MEDVKRKSLSFFFPGYLVRLTKQKHVNQRKQKEYLLYFEYTILYIDQVVLWGEQRMYKSFADEMDSL